MSQDRAARRELLKKLKEEYGFITVLDFKKEYTKVMLGISELPTDRQVKLLSYVKLQKEADPKFNEFIDKLNDVIVTAIKKHKGIIE